MNTTLADAYLLARGVLHGVEHMERITTVIFPPTIWLTELSQEVLPPGMLPHLKMGAQNMHYEDQGTFTGETSPLMLKEVVEYVLVGHSERVKHFHESPHDSALKLQAAFKHGLQPILCVGEFEQTEKARLEVANLMEEIVEDLDEQHQKELIVAYEPVWAISDGTHPKPATPDYAEKTMGELNNRLPDGARVLYGGSATGDNAAGFLNCPACDGLLIGGASLKLNSFLKAAQVADDLAGKQGFLSLHTLQN